MHKVEEEMRAMVEKGGGKEGLHCKYTVQRHSSTCSHAMILHVVSDHCAWTPYFMIAYLGAGCMPRQDWFGTTRTGDGKGTVRVLCAFACSRVRDNGCIDTCPCRCIENQWLPKDS